MTDDPVTAAERLIDDVRVAAARELQMLTTGAIMGIMIRELQAQGLMLVDIDPVVDANGNYEPYLYLTGKVSKTRLKISVEDVTER